MQVRFITDLPKATDRARARVGRVVSLTGAGVLGLSVVPQWADPGSRSIGNMADMCGRRCVSRPRRPPCRPPWSG